MKIGKYIKLLPSIWKNRENIVEGWLTDIKLEKGELPEDEINEILRRRAICYDCPLNSILAKTSKEYKELYKTNYKDDGSILHCSICSCPINKKTASLSSNCGLEIYNEDHPDNKQPLKWEKYKQEK